MGKVHWVSLFSEYMGFPNSHFFKYNFERWRSLGLYGPRISTTKDAKRLHIDVFFINIVVSQLCEYDYKIEIKFRTILNFYHFC